MQELIDFIWVVHDCFSGNFELPIVNRSSVVPYKYCSYDFCQYGYHHHNHLKQSLLFFILSCLSLPWSHYFITMNSSKQCSDSYFSDMLCYQEGNQPVLCGRLADQGHTVVGVEVAQKAIEDFFAEQKVAFTSQPAPEVEGTLFQVLLMPFLNPKPPI